MKNNSTPEFRGWFRKEIIPRSYLPWLHIGFNLFILLGLSGFFISRLSAVQAWEWLTIPFGLFVGNFGVFVIHKYFLHTNIVPMAYKIHAKWHHNFFTDETVTYESPRDFYILFFPPWVVLVFGLAVLPALYWIVSRFFSSNVTFLFLLMMASYFFLYELFHYVSHLPDDHWVLKMKYLKFMRNHHRLHHRPSLMHKYNFNVVFPLFDLLMGTFYLEKKKRLEPIKIKSTGMV